MNILENINRLILEGYIFSDKTISIDLDKFESGESNKLLITGLSGGGKTTLGKYLSKKYSAEFFDTDWLGSETKGLDLTKEEKVEYKRKRFFELITNDKRLIIGGIGILTRYKFPETKQVILKLPHIFLGVSLLKSSLRVLMRPPQDLKNNTGRIKSFINMGKENINLFYDMINNIKKERIEAGGEIKEFSVPKL